MTTSQETDELVKRLRKLTVPPYDSGCFGKPMKKAADAIERLEAQVKKVVIRCNALESNSLLKTTEVELAEARAEVAAWERKFGGRTDFNEALTAPAPEECPHGCRGTGWIGAGNSWGDTAALPCPLHEPTPKREAERRVVCPMCEDRLPGICPECGACHPQQEPTPDEESGGG